MLSYSLPLEGQKRGGIERAAHTLAEGLARRNHDVVVFSHDPKPLGRRTTCAGAAVEVLREHVDRTTPDDGVSGERAGDGSGLHRIRCRHRPRRQSSVAIDRKAHAARDARQRARRSAVGDVDRALCVQLGVYGQEFLTALTSRGVIAVSDNTTRDNPFIAQVIPHGVDENIFTPWPADKTAEPSVLFVGALDGRKRGHFLIDGFVQTIRPAHPDATLTIVGETGPAHPGVRYLTGVSDADLADLYRRAWVYASPSTYEGFGLPYLEAMACGTPVVASENPGSLDVLGGSAVGCGRPTPSLPRQSRRCSVTKRGVPNCRLPDCGARRSSRSTRMLESYEKVLFDLTGVYVKSMASV